VAEVVLDVAEDDPAPFLTNSAAVALPMPLAPPVITATFPASLQATSSVNSITKVITMLP
jgi:hypothetical protein